MRQRWERFRGEESGNERDDGVVDYRSVDSVLGTGLGTGRRTGLETGRGFTVWISVSVESVTFLGGGTRARFRSV